MGCYEDTENRAIPTLEGQSFILDGNYVDRVDPIMKCAVAALSWGYNMFAVQDGGWCAASATAPLTFDKYGKSTACSDSGEGGPGANEVYVIKGTSKYTPIMDVIKMKDCRLLWDEITSDSANPLHELLPAQRARSLRKRGHNYILPPVRTQRFKRCFFNRCLFEFV